MSWNYSASLSKKSVASLPKGQGGFGLVELMVSISIMVIISAIILTRQSSFNGAVLLRGQAYEIALQIREIQLSAVSASSDGGGDFRSILGVYFDSSSPNNQKYHIFKDANSNGFYDPIEAFGIQGILDDRFEISEIRAMAAVPYTVPEISVVFVRPNFDARFFISTAEVIVPSIEIDVVRKDMSGSGPGYLRTIEVTATGQISVI